MSNLSGATTAVFIVRLSAALEVPVTVDWQTKDGTAKAGTDYEAASGSVTFEPGQTEKQVQVVVYGRAEGDTETRAFSIQLYPPENAILDQTLTEVKIEVTDESGVAVTSLVVATGPRGLKGDPGLSSYQLAVLQGYQGTLEDYIKKETAAGDAAERAITQADRSQQEADRAEAEADRAESIVDVNGTYPTIAAGLAATTSGQYFRVPQGETSDISFIYYRNNSGVAVVVATLSSAFINQLIGRDDNKTLAAIIDKDGQFSLVVDEHSAIYTPDSSASLNQRLNKLGYDRAPAIARITDEYGAVHQFLDEFGGLQLPGLQGSVQGNITRTQKRLADLIARRRVYDARECGMNPFSSEDQWYALQLATDKLAAMGGGLIYIPEGAYRFSRLITPRSNVGYIGAGKKKTRLLPFRASAMFTFRGTTSNYIDNLLFADFTIDGENQTLNPTSGYLPEIKAIFLQYWSNSIIDNLEIVNIGATGLGVDMPYNCLITRNLVENCGRLAEQGALGASGIGLGTGALASEPIFVSQNLCKNNKNYGIFFEPQASGAAQDAICAENVCVGNYAGIADCGIEGLLVANNSLRENVHGFLMYPGTNNGGKPGRRGRLQGNIIRANTENGITSSSSKTDNLVGEYAFFGNHIYENAKDGVNFNYTNNNVRNLSNTFTNNEIFRNGRHGINFVDGDVSNVDITHNRIYANGKTEAGNGINISVPMAASSISFNSIRDTQPTVTQQYPIAISGNLTDVKIAENHCVGNAQNTINLTGTNTNLTLRNNDGIN